MDIARKCGYPASALSNFAGHRFIIDGVEVYSMEGFLQSLKFSNPEMQKHICKLVGLAAKRAGANKKWQTLGKLYWQGKSIDRYSNGYQTLLDNAYDCMYQQSQSFKEALEKSGSAPLTHSIGKHKQSDTVLTQSEFCSRLMNLRKYGKANPTIDKL